MNSKHWIEVTDNEFVIHLDIDLLIFGVENNPDGTCKITDKDAFLKYLVERLFEYEMYYEDHPALFLLFDRLTENAIEDAEDFVLPEWAKEEGI
jgi:hypothetical protein